MTDDDIGPTPRDGAAPDDGDRAARADDVPAESRQAGAPAPHAEPEDPAASGPRFTVEELENAWRRALADLDNARKRHARELRHEAEAERRRVCLAWLPVVDNLELALEHADGDPSVIIGVRAVRDQAVALLASLGFPRDDEAGVPFDPQRHEATGLVDDPASAPGTVVKVLRPGYGRPPDGQLRPAAVLVSRKQE
jgi:molecular chaperone GrpE